MTRGEALTIRLRLGAWCLIGQRFLSGSVSGGNVLRCRAPTWRVSPAVSTSVASRSSLDVDSRHGRPSLETLLEPCIICPSQQLLSSMCPSSVLGFRHFTALARAEAITMAPSTLLEPVQVHLKMPKPKVLQKEEHPLRNHMISKSAWRVLKGLRSAGHECYLVGGSVRDLFLQKVPKDFDVLSTASLKEWKI
ncbi:hypothetical protein CBR_g40920 [Chara braunii]|uniref:Poly A polymerase head domain-containing protein n=1 Tax=Chara braunii TaxID=69332 RepID=A0A388K2E0_CHABU|nr:hypothetical protein CBR_g40920 [Chara braunii]|eukprot:GBG64220.1 hypothetical protein CBR_g40920 [Chara braunii]